MAACPSGPLKPSTGGAMRVDTDGVGPVRLRADGAISCDCASLRRPVGGLVGLGPWDRGEGAFGRQRAAMRHAAAGKSSLRAKMFSYRGGRNN